MLLGKLRAQRLVLVIASQYVDLGYRPIQSSQEGRRPTKRSRTVRYPRIRRLPAFRPHKRAGTTADRLHYIHKDKKGQSAPVFAEPRQRRGRRSKTDDAISESLPPKDAEIASLRSQRRKGLHLIGSWNGNGLTWQLSRKDQRMDKSPTSRSSQRNSYHL